MELRIDASDLVRLRGRLEQFSDRRWQSGLAAALTGAAFAIRGEWGGQIVTRLDRPTQLSRGAVRVDRADVGRLQAVVRLNGQAQADVQPAEYLATQEAGGDRRQKKFERALQASGAMPAGHKVVPGKGARLDQFGNIARGQIVQVLNQLGANLSVGYRQVIGRTAAKRAASADRAGRKYVAVPVARGGLKPGIYERTGRGMVPVFWFVRGTRYGKRLRLLEHARVVATRELPARIDAEMTRRMRSLIARNA